MPARSARRWAILAAVATLALTEGQRLSRDLGYIPLPAEVASRALAALDRIR